MIRVVLADDQTLMRRGLRGLLDLTEDLTVVAEAADGEEALQVIAGAAPDVVLLDVRMPKLTGVEVLKRLRAMDRLPPTILLTTFDDDAALLEGIRAGARGFLLKDVSFERLTDTIRRVAAGETLIRPAVTERVLRGLEGLRPEFESLDPPDALSRRETEGSASWPAATTTARSPTPSAAARGRSRTTSPASSPSSACATAPAPCSKRWSWDISRRSERVQKPLTAYPREISLN